MELAGWRWPARTRHGTQAYRQRRGGTHRARKRHVRSDMHHELGANPFDAYESRNGTERTVLFTIADDALGERGPDTRQRFELLGGCPVNIDKEHAVSSGSLTVRCTRRRDARGASRPVAARAAHSGHALS